LTINRKPATILVLTLKQEIEMNERIKQLAKQAKKSATKNETYNLAFVMADFEQKFAELIVRECMEQVWHNRDDVVNGNISEVIKERMKQHFGVEE
jgi:hypothetical protein